ncbi:hypothetical protein LCGC14_3141540 [marine sediment metagenome]|uniref:Uncharacterized protein n=1 Tax=marine sediment metagenome TaxID=412755 RepID=A0A0F8Y3L2_9ZZZZ
MDGDILVSVLRSEGMKLTLPLPPNRANAREHWTVTWKKKTEYYTIARNALFAQRPAAPPETRMRLSSTLYLWAKMDQGNLVARLKWLEDSLVNFGLLVDDSEKWLDLQMPKQVIDRKNMRVEIELVPCEGEE